MSESKLSHSQKRAVQQDVYGWDDDVEVDFQLTAKHT